MTPRPPRLHKFGGSSVADAALMRHITRLEALDADTPLCVVVSAMRGVTDALTALAESAARGEDWQPGWQALCRQHLQAAAELDPENRHQAADWFKAEFAALAEQLERLAAAPAPLSPQALAAVQGLGEVWSSRLMQMAFGGEAAGWARLDAREVLHIEQDALGPAVNWAQSRARLAQWRARHPQPNVVITGFIGRDAEGRPATLGRNGSDWSAAIFAVLFEADELTIWTDVDGVLSADPRLAPDAFCLSAMSYAEACELAYFGAKVLHPKTMAPAMQAGLPIRIRNTFNAAAPGTLICANPPPPDSPVKGLSLYGGLALLELAGAGMMGVPGTAERLFSALHAVGVSVAMISQGSSEHSICCVIPEVDGERAQQAVSAAFAQARAQGQIEGVTLTPGISVLAAVGDGMIGTPGVTARLTRGLAQARVNIRATAQAASERSISVAINSTDAVRALRAAHSAFWLSPATVSVGLIGPGNVGGTLLKQLAKALPALAADSHPERRLDLRLRAIANRRRMHLAPRQLDPAEALASLQTGEDFDLARFTAHVQAEHLPHALIVDCSGSDEIAAHYPAWLAAGIHVVTPAKHAGSGDWARYQAIRAAQKSGGSQFRYEASVGAGLPVIHTLRNLLDTGDVLTGFEGILSGTLAWLFNRFDGSVPFSQLLLEARARGFTEPDPRDDLSGTDVARKLVILAREAGLALSLEDVAVENLVPETLRALPLEDFLARVAEMDAPMQARLQAAQAEGRQLRYLARLDADGRAEVALTAPPPGHASLHTRATDNLIQFHTRLYADNPLVVQGPGAGAEVTAAGVFGDILIIARNLGALA